MEDGHICLPLQQLPTEEAFWESFPGGLPNPSAADLDPRWVGRKTEDWKPFVLHQDNLYLNRYFHYETRVLQKLEELCRQGEAEKAERKAALADQQAFLRSLQTQFRPKEELHGLERPDWQLTAALHAWLNNVTLLTGGPGTGKTTTVAKLLLLLNQLNPELRFAFAAPTGKAAVRMREALVQSAKNLTNVPEGLIERCQPTTIHKLLISKGPQSRFFKLDDQNQLPFEVIIIDESSMIGFALFAKLLDAIPSTSRLILLGDSDQLASVDAGSMFGDLCRALKSSENRFSKEDLTFFNSFLAPERALDETQWLEPKGATLHGHLIRLHKTYRYESDSPMGKFTKAIIEQQLDFLEEQMDDFSRSAPPEKASKTPSKQAHLSLHEADYPLVLERFCTHFHSYILEPDIPKALEKLNEVRILCTLRETELGVQTINEEVEYYLKKGLREKGIHLRIEQEVYEHQPIMVTKNRSDLDLVNGDVGIVRCLEANGPLVACFPCNNPEELGAQFKAGVFQGFKAINPSFLSEKETVYAMTIHKSQGSEFSQVLVYLPGKEGHRLLSAELLYTALTRVKSKGNIGIIGHRSAVLEAASRRISRMSGIEFRLNNSKPTN